MTGTQQPEPVYFSHGGGKKLGRKFCLLLLIFLILISFLIFIPLQQAIVFKPNHSTDKLAFIPIQNERQFQIKYTHSIHLSDVVESYEITENKMIQQYELMYEDFAIGMPADAAKGEIFEQVNGKYYIKNMKRVFPYFHLRIGQVRANHRVIYKNKEYPLSRVLQPGTSVKVVIKKLNFFQQWKGVNILESI
ncbi:DUF1850 domain-containing protein [Neobacillus sp. K501]